MPSNQIDVSIHIESPQADIQALQKLTEALKTIPGAQGGGGGRIQQTFATQGEAGSFLNKQAAGAEAIGQKLTGAKVKASEGGYEASADVSPEQKKAFNPGGAIAAMATGVGVTVGIFKQLLGMSKIFQTFMGTTGKILATAVDLMLAPLMPFFMRIMIWLIQTIFPLATKAGNWLGGLGDVGTGAALVGGFVALKFGPKLLTEAGKSLGNALVNKIPYDTMGKNISAGITLAKGQLKAWGTAVGTMIKDGFIATKDALVTFSKALGTAIKDGFVAAKDALVTFSKTLGTAIKDGFVAAKDALVTFSKTLGTAIKEGFVAAKDALVTFSKSLGTAIKEGFVAAKDALVTFSKSLGTAIKTGFIEAKDALVTFSKSLGTAIKEGFVAAKDALVTFSKSLGTAIKTGFIEAKDALVTFSKSLGTAIKTGFINAKDALVSFSKELGTAIKTGFIDAKDALVKFSKELGTAIKEGFIAAKDALVSFAKTLGTAIKDGFIVAKDALVTFAKTLGTAIKDGLVAAKDIMVSTFKTIGTALSGAASSAMQAASKVWTAVGGAIGAAIGASKKAFTAAGEAIGSAISVAMKGAKNLWSGLGSVGGLIGVGIGAAAIGATIGYMMWKEYDKYQQGKDITKGLSQLEQVRMLQQNYGISEEQAVTIQEGMAAGGVSVSRQGMDDWMKMSQDIADQVRLFGNYDPATLAAMERKEQLLFADMMEGGMFGEKDTFQGMVEMIRAGQTTAGTSIGSAEETLANQALITSKERIAAAEAEIEAQAWYAMSIGGQHINFLDMAVKSLLPGGGFGFGGAITSKLGFGTAGGNVKEDEKKVREALGRLYGGGSFKGEMTGEQANLGAWLSAVQGDAASSFFSEDVASDLLGGKYQDEEIKRMGGSVINIMLNTDSLDFLTHDQRAKLMELLPAALENGVVSPSYS